MKVLPLPSQSPNQGKANKTPFDTDRELQRHLHRAEAQRKRRCGSRIILSTLDGKGVVELPFALILMDDGEKDN
jgi:hypothetical protein